MARAKKSTTPALSLVERARWAGDRHACGLGAQTKVVGRATAKATTTSAKCTAAYGAGFFAGFVRGFKNA